MQPPLPLHPLKSEQPLSVFHPKWDLKSRSKMLVMNVLETTPGYLRMRIWGKLSSLPNHEYPATLY
jgi:hypothetical protein